MNVTAMVIHCPNVCWLVKSCYHLNLQSLYTVVFLNLKAHFCLFVCLVCLWGFVDNANMLNTYLKHQYVSGLSNS